MNYKFVTNTVIEGTSLEDACSKMATHFSTIARHVGSGEALDSCDPCFTVTEDAKGTPVTLSDPITDAIAAKKREESQPAVVEEPADSATDTTTKNEA